MARFSFFSFAFLLLFALLAFAADCSHIAQHTIILDSVSHPAGAEGSVTKQECPAKCGLRCSGRPHAHIKPCILVCNYCCRKCLCVPSGTHGNREDCPCYHNIKTPHGTNYCP